MLALAGLAIAGSLHAGARARRQLSEKSCPDGFDGHIVHVPRATSSAATAAAKWSAQLHRNRGTRVDAVFSYLNAFAVHADSDELDSMAADGLVKIEANCIHKLRLPTGRQMHSSSSATQARAHSVSADGKQWQPPWNLDRIDAHGPGLDQQYHYGKAHGKGSRIYVLDNGILGTHDDFGGRVVPGYSARCFDGRSEGCEATWYREGLITARNEAAHPDCRKNSQFDHGTGVASVAAGTEFGVAKKATVVPVQAHRLQ